MEITEVTRTEARKLLEQWHQMVADRDNRIIIARLAGMTGAEIAGVMRISPNTVGSVVAAAKNKGLL
jgi:DNA-directed RNA polymerase specialized sigma24 family protein